MNLIRKLKVRKDSPPKGAEQRRNFTQLALATAGRQRGVLTHITEARSIGNHADMGAASRTTVRVPLTVLDVVRDGVRRRTRNQEAAAAQSTWDSEGGATARGR